MPNEPGQGRSAGDCALAVKLSLDGVVHLASNSPYFLDSSTQTSAQEPHLLLGLKRN